MVHFLTKNPNLGKFWRVLEWETLVYIFYGHLECITAIWHILWVFRILVAFWYSFSRFGILCQEKSGNPGYSDVILVFFKGQFQLFAILFHFLQVKHFVYITQGLRIRPLKRKMTLDQVPEILIRQNKK
jgi:hypothetical protein